MTDMKKMREDIRKDGSLRNRLDSLEAILNNPKQEYPTRMRMLGFPTLKIKNKEELEFRMKELCDILGYKYEDDDK